MHNYSTTSDRLKAYSLVAIISVVVSIFITKVASGLNIAPAWLVSPPALAGVYGAIYWLVDTRLWRWKPLHQTGIIGERPIDGSYTGNIVSNYNRKDVPVKIVIDQTWTKLLIQLDVLEPKLSTSCSVIAAYEDVGNGDIKLTYTYRNNPNDGIADEDMAAHEGTVEMNIKPGGEVNGRYFNSRGRKGTIYLKKN